MRYVRLGVLMLSIPLLSAMALRHGASATTATQKSLLASMPLGFTTDCITCVQCATAKHSIEDAPQNPDRRYQEPIHSCADGWCSVAHPESDECDGGFAALDPAQKTSVWLAAISEAPEQLAMTVKTYEAVLTLNVERRALQAVNCSGEIAFSIPLSPSQMEMLLN